MPTPPMSLVLRKAVSLCRVQVLCSSLRASILIGKVRHG